VAASAAVIAALAGAVAVLGSPMKQRQYALDERRLSDLRDISNTVLNHARKHDALPQELSVLDAQEWAPPRHDPDTSQPYEYKVMDEQSFQLCAVFALSSSALEQNRRYPYRRSTERTHDAGKQCFTYTRNENTGCGK
jgi:hypothetical protein